EALALSLSSVSEQLWIQILSYAEPPHPSLVGVACRILLPASRDNMLWKLMCQHHWHDKLPHRWSELLSQTAGAETTLVASGARAASVDWLRMFQEAWLDAKRTAISVEELCEVSWMVTFESRWDGRVSRQGFFLPNRTFHNNKGQWSTSVPWDLKLGGKRVVLGHFADLVVSRTETWGWRMQNSTSLYESFVPEASDGARALLLPPRFMLPHEFIRGNGAEEESESVSGHSRSGSDVEGDRLDTEVRVRREFVSMR
ncbi:unnamed protein product, partial [Polarella glacialis]